MDWTTPLKAQQTDFIQRLKSAKLLHCDEKGQHSELTIISDERSKPLRNFCWEMIRKYKPNDPQNYFINNMKGKLGEEVVKSRLADFVTEVDYEKRVGGDGKVDFTLTSDSSIGIQVKARNGNFDKIQWSISREEIEKNAVLVCILIQEEVSEAQAKYNLILAGFLPTNMITTPHRVKNISNRNRLSFPFFFDPNFDVEVKPIKLGSVVNNDHEERWDKANVHDFHGTYGDYVLSKVSKVFPELRRVVL